MTIPLRRFVGRSILSLEQGNVYPRSENRKRISSCNRPRWIVDIIYVRGIFILENIE